MHCSWCEERFERFLDGNLSTGEHARLLAHVDGCANCHGLLEELRCVDALLLAPQTIELPPDFTVATMDDVRTLPPPRVRRAPIAASLVAYVVAAWSLVAAAVLIAPGAVRGAALSVYPVAATVVAAFAGLGRVLVRLGDRGDMSAWTNVAGGLLIAEGAVLLAIVLALRAARLRIGERVRR